MDILDKERLKECRLRLGITKQEAAKKIQISQPAYLRYEAGSRNPSIQIISKMAEVFSTSTDYLIGKSSDPITVLSSCPPPCGHFSIQESAAGGLSYKVKIATALPLFLIEHI